MVLISEFARAAGLSVDTVRFYVRKGLLTPETDGKGGSNPYQMFRAEHVEAARLIRMGQSLGFSLKEIAALGAEYRAGALTPDRSAQVMQAQLEKLEGKANDLAGMIAYVRAKIDWITAGREGHEPRFETFADGKSARTMSIALPHGIDPPPPKPAA